jgi:hypothetical protein
MKKGKQIKNSATPSNTLQASCIKGKSNTWCWAEGFDLFFLYSMLHDWD